MPVTIQLLGLCNGEPTGNDMEYVVDYDPTPRMGANGVFVYLVTTRDRTLSRQFANIEDAVSYWQADSLGDPRPDGKPNRPLTAYSISIESVK
jgi:hypothetical protein